MTTEQRKRFTVISNNEINNNQERHRTYQTNPLKEKLMKFTNEEAGKKFGIEDLLKWQYCSKKLHPTTQGKWCTAPKYDKTSGERKRKKEIGLNVPD